MPVSHHPLQTPQGFVPQAPEVSQLRAWVRCNYRWPRIGGTTPEERHLAAWVRTTLDTGDAPTTQRVRHILAAFSEPKAGRPRRDPGYVIPVLTQRVSWEESFEVLKQFYQHMDRLPRTSVSCRVSPAEAALGVRLRRLTAPSSANYRPEVRKWADSVRAELARQERPNTPRGAKRGPVLSHDERLKELEAFVHLNLRRPITTACDPVEAALGQWYRGWLARHPEATNPTTLRISLLLKDYPTPKPGPKSTVEQAITPKQRITRVRQVLLSLREGKPPELRDAQQALEDLEVLAGIITQ